MQCVMHSVCRSMVQLRVISSCMWIIWGSGISCYQRGKNAWLVLKISWLFPTDNIILKVNCSPFWHNFLHFYLDCAYNMNVSRCKLKYIWWQGQLSPFFMSSLSSHYLLPGRKTQYKDSSSCSTSVKHWKRSYWCWYPFLHFFPLY